MKCPRCNGTGKITEWVATDTLSEYEFPCRKCNGTGEIEVTNEQWFCGLSTEEKAKWFGDWHSFSCVFCKHWKNGCVYNHNQVRCAIEEGKSNKELWMEWLKEKHDGK